MVSSAHAVCAKGLYIAMISTTVETGNPEGEIKPALELFGVLEMFTKVSTLYEPLDDGTSDNVYYIHHFIIIVIRDKELRCLLSLRECH